VRRQRAADGGQPRGRHRHPQVRPGSDAERGLVDVDIEVEDAGRAEFIDPAPHRGLVPVGGLS
jgi:hypothetical protein